MGKQLEHIGNMGKTLVKPLVKYWKLMRNPWKYVACPLNVQPQAAMPAESEGPGADWG